MKKKTKIIIAIAFIIAIITSFTVGCHASETNTADISSPTTITAKAAESTFSLQKIEEQNLNEYTKRDLYATFYREKTTDVMYVVYSTSNINSGCSITVMLDPQTGGPLTYDNWVKNYKNK